MDIYFTKEWGIVNQLIEDGEPEEFEVSTENGCIRNLFIIRKIPWLVDGKQYYDITTPYGYGGPYIVNCADGRKEQLLAEYESALKKFCEDHDIVSEFVRFHPIVGNGVDFQKIYNAECIRHTVGTNLDCDDPVQMEFSKSCRKKIKKAIKEGVKWEVIENPQNIDDFLNIYYSTMKRNESQEFYYFPKEYFDKCIELFGEHILLVQAIYNDEVIASGFFLTYKDTIHIHLSGTKTEYLYLSPACIIRYATAIWGKERGFKLMHNGGGRSNSDDDSLYLFKLNFTDKTLFDFYVGRKVWNEKIYDRLVKMTQTGESNYFPKYRG